MRYFLLLCFITMGLGGACYSSERRCSESVAEPKIEEPALTGLISDLAALWLNSVQNPASPWRLKVGLQQQYHDKVVDLARRSKVSEEEILARLEETKTELLLGENAALPKNKKNQAHPEISQLSRNPRKKLVFTHEEPVLSATFSPNGRSIVTTSSSQIALWNIQSQLYTTFTPNLPEYVSSVYSHDGAYLVTSSKADTVVHEFSTGKQTHFKGRNDLPVASVFNKESLLVYNGPQVLIWNINGVRKSPLQAPLIFANHPHFVNSAVFSPNGKYILTASGFTAFVWDINNPSVPHKTFANHCSLLYSAVFSPDGQSILTASILGPAKLWSLDDTLNPLKTFDGNGSKAFFSPNGKYVLTVSFFSFEGKVNIWSADNDTKPIASITDPSTTAAFCPESRYLLTASANDNAAILWAFPDDEDLP